MKFGQNFHLFRVPEWEPFYVSYDLLRKLLNTTLEAASPLGTEPNFTELYACLGSNINAVSKFRNDKYQFVRQKETEVWKRYGIAPHGSTIPALEEVDPCELRELLEAFTELQNDLIKLQWYDRVNQDAINRIYVKLEKFSKPGSSHHDQKPGWIRSQLVWSTQCLKDVERLNNLVAEIGRARSHVQPGSTRRSLYLQYICNRQYPALAYPSAIYHAIKDDQPSAMARLLERITLRTLDQLGSSQKSVLQTDDALGRLPLHYGVLYGLNAICQLILSSLKRWEQNSAVLRDTVLWVDSEGYTPLHFAVIHNHAAVTRLFLDIPQLDYQIGDGVGNQHLRSVLNDLLFIALRSQYDDIVCLLVSNHIDSNYRSGRGETALYVAAQIGRDDYVKTLLEAASDENTKDISETIYGWTPLFVASVEGHLAVVKLLLQAGASQTILDHRGWTAKEHAAYRGYLVVAETLELCNASEPTGGPASKPVKTTGSVENNLRAGHSVILANLGVMQKGRQVIAVNLDCCSSEPTRSLHIDTRFSIEVSSSGENASSHLVQLPILDHSINEPFVFHVKNPSEAQLIFNIFRSDPAHGTKGIIIGSGTALLESQSHFFGTKRESLIREHTIPILERESLRLMGTVAFTFVIAKPLPHLEAHPPATYRLKEADKVQLVGHGGLGQNIASRNYLQSGENTIESFLSAAKLGASFVEFDVQLTRDLVPVIYHDFSLSESGTDIPIHDLSLKQFTYASRIQSPRGNPVSIFGETVSKTPQDRMKYTVDFINKGFKPNTRGDFVQDSFTTLEELLIDLPRSISFNVEIKYPRLHEAVDAGVAPVAIELNTFIDGALDRIFRFGKDRTIILSSFTPEVCILLSLKQQVYPVMYITDAGKPPITDMEARAGSMKVAVRFVKRWNLAGIVFASEPLLLCPRLIKCVKNSGLTCASYGLQNNIPENVKLQVEAGLDIIMADRVGLIAKTLQSLSI